MILRQKSQALPGFIIISSVELLQPFLYLLRTVLLFPRFEHLVVASLRFHNLSGLGVLIDFDLALTALAASRGRSVHA